MAELDLPVEIGNAGALTEVFGYWPSFHDAEIHAITLDRAGRDGPFLDARVHVFEMTSNVDDRGYYVLRHHRLVTFRFGNIAAEHVRWFNHQNVLSEAIFEAAPAGAEGSRRWHVLLDSTYGCEVDLLCDRIEVVSVEPFTPAT